MAEERKFEDSEYLKKYFAEMRTQIEYDFLNIDKYFPADLGRKKGRASPLFKQQVDLAKLYESDEELLATAISINKLNQNKSSDIS